MATKLYFQNTGATGSVAYPSVASSLSSVAPIQVSMGGVNRGMTTAIGAGQTGQTGTTQATTTNNTILLGRFISAPIAAQTILASMAITVGAAYSESSLNSNFLPSITLVVWRPGTTSIVGNRFFDQAAFSTLTEPTVAAAQQWFSGTGPSGPASDIVTADGDVLIVEFWRDTTAQSMATAYTNTLFFGGATEGSTTDAASYINFANTIAFYVPTNPPYRNPMPPLLAQ